MLRNIFGVTVRIVSAAPVTGATKAVSAVQGLHQGNWIRSVFCCDGVYGNQKRTTPLLCLLLIPYLVLAHGGRTDKYGCHNDRKNGGYHCHNSGSVAKPQNFRTPNNPAATNSTRPQLLKTQPANSQVRDTNLAAYKTLVLETQSTFNKLGCNAGSVDGVLGKQTIKAIQHFQVANEIAMDGKPSYLLLEVLLGRV